MENVKLTLVFDPQDFATLNEMAAAGGSSIGDVVQGALQVLQTLQTLADEGFSEVIVRNSRTGERQSVSIPFVRRNSASSPARYTSAASKVR